MYNNCNNFVLILTLPNTTTMEITSPTIDTGAMLRIFCKQKRIYKAALARKMGISYQAVFYYLKASSMDVQKLLAFSHALGHNFLLDAASQLPATYTTNATASTAPQEEIAQLKAQLQILTAEKNLLEKIVMGRE